MVRALHEIAGRRGQSLAQMVLAWTLRDLRTTSTLVGASSPAQLETNVATRERLDFSSAEPAEIDRHATESGIDSMGRVDRRLRRRARQTSARPSRRTATAAGTTIHSSSDVPRSRPAPSPP